MAQVITSSTTTEPEASRPVTLASASLSICNDDREWHSSHVPNHETWARLTHTLARADKAATAMTGLHSVLREHHFALEVAEDSEVEYVGITGYQAGCIEDALDCLIGITQSALDDLRKATTNLECR